MNLSGKVAIITGASRGIGLAASQALVKKKAIVYGIARDTDRLLRVGDQLGGSFHPVSCDVADVDKVTNAVFSIADEAGRIDILINNAGVGYFGSVETLSPEDWLRMMDTNVNGTFYFTRAVVPFMKVQNSRSGFGGHVINMGSTAGLIGNPELSGYNLTKYGLRGFTEALMKELRHDGIKVTGIYPGSVATDFVDNGRGDSSWKLKPDEIAQTLVHVLEMPDSALISDIVIRPTRPPRR